jgi:HD-GYP domain-containing protein (c-di-GMP phosphodiesterase class II)
MGKIILEQVRDVDIAARYGGEEFAVILPEISGTPARNVAERLRAAVEQELFRLPNGNEIGVTVTIGISCYPNCSTDTTAIVSTADQALYVGKQSGRNRTLLYRETLKARIDKDPDLIVQLLGESLGNVLPIVTAISAKAPFLRLHSDVVNEAAQRLAAAMHLSAGEIETLRLAALLHDIGMLVVPDKVLIRRGPLAPEDWQEIRRHPVAGADLLARVPALAEVAKIVRHHHERYDGRGYPDGLQAGDLPLLARILAIADSYGTMVSDWPGHKAVPREEACRRLREGAGTQFDPDMVERLIQSLPAEDCGGSQALSA